MESFPAPVRAMLEVNKNLIVDYLDTQWDKDILRLPLIIDYWSHTVHQSISKYGFGGEFAKDFVRHVVDNYGEADYGKRKS